MKIIDSKYTENVILTVEMRKEILEEFTNNSKNINFKIIKYKILEEKNIEI